MDANHRSISAVIFDVTITIKNLTTVSEAQLSSICASDIKRQEGASASCLYILRIDQLPEDSPAHQAVRTG